MQTGTCEVHKWALNDSAPRLVNYCSVCDAWMCSDCANNMALRAYAALRKKLFG